MVVTFDNCFSVFTFITSILSILLGVLARVFDSLISNLLTGNFVKLSVTPVSLRDLKV